MDGMILEGTWEEIRDHDAELAEQRVRLIVLNNSLGNDGTSAADTEDAPTDLPTLDKLFEGYIGRVSFGPPDLARNSEKVFGEIVSQKYEEQKSER